VKEAAHDQIQKYHAQVKDGFAGGAESASVQKMINDIKNDVLVAAAVGRLALQDQVHPYVRQLFRVEYADGRYRVYFADQIVEETAKSTKSNK